MKRVSMLVALSMVVSIGGAVATPAAMAAVRPTGFTITQSTDAKDAKLGDGKCDSNSTTSGNQCTLRAAVMEANWWGPGPNVNFKIGPGTYTLSIKGSGEDTAATGDLDLLTDVTFNGTTARDAIITGPALGDRLIDVPTGNRANVKIVGITLQSGTAPTGEDGGGIRFRGTGTLSMSNTSLIRNSAGGSGGGIYINSGTFDITGKNTFDGNQAGAWGGAVDVEGNLSPTLSNLIVQNNQAGDGGGLAAYTQPGSGGTLTVSADTFTNNTAVDSGGGLYQEGGILSMPAPNTFTKNSAGVNGGGIDLEGATSADVGNLTVTDNHAQNGGGVTAFALAGSTGSMTMSGNSTIAGNVATANGGGLDLARSTIVYTDVLGNQAENGGGVQIRPSQPATVLGGRVKVGGNTASVNGGGVYAANCSTTSVCSVVGATVGLHAPYGSPPDSTGNAAALAGSGIYVTGALDVIGTTVGGNTIGGTGPGPGGTIYHAPGAGVLTLINDTIAENQGGQTPGGVVIASTVTDVLTNDTIAANTGVAANALALAGSGAPPVVRNTILSTASLGATCTPGAAISLGHNLDSANLCGLSVGLADIINADPMLNVLHDAGGGNNTMRPKANKGSPVVDAGANTGCPATDQRFVTRPQPGGTCDIGAYEESPWTRNSQISVTVTAPGSVAKGSNVTYTITVKNGGPLDSVNTTLQDVLPASLTYVSCSRSDQGSCGGSGNSRTLTFSALRVAATVTVTIVARVNTSTSDSSVTNVVSAASDNPDTFQLDNTAGVTTQIV